MKLTPYRYPAVRPELPPVERWIGYTLPAYQANWFTNFGSVSRALETELGRRWGGESAQVVCAANATLALAAPLIANRVDGPVLMPAFTFPATLSAVKIAGATPVLVDVGMEDWLVSPETLEKGFRTTGARAAIVLAPFGLSKDFREHVAVARAADAIMVIDNAPGLGVPRCPLEDLCDTVYEVYSLHATKPFGIGEGGAIFSHRGNESRLRAALNFGLPDFGVSGGPLWGINGKMSEVQAAIGLAVFEDFEARISRRQKFALQYQLALRGCSGLSFPRDPAMSAWQIFPVLVESPSAAASVVENAKTSGLEVRRYYRPSLTKIVEGVCAVSDQLADRMCCFPVYSNVVDTEVNEIVRIGVESLLNRRLS